MGAVHVAQPPFGLTLPGNVVYDTPFAALNAPGEWANPDYLHTTIALSLQILTVEVQRFRGCLRLCGSNITQLPLYKYINPI